MDVVVMYEDQDGRVLSDPFVKLPTRRELPDYYEIIKKPVDITKIQNKIDDGKVKLNTSNSLSDQTKCTTKYIYCF